MGFCSVLGSFVEFFIKKTLVFMGLQDPDFAVYGN
jgi:hypothetical protein